MKRIIVAAILGGIAMFVWGMISHMILPLGEMGLENLPNEEAVVPVLQSNIPEAGLYFFPGMNPDASEPEMEAWTKKYAAGPVGLMVYSPQGEEPMGVGQMLTELLSNMLACLFAAIVVSNCRAGFLAKALLVSLFGFAAFCSISLSYWNWYMFPTEFALAEGLDQVIGFFAGGLMIAWMQLRRS